MKAKKLLRVTSVLFLLVPCAFAQRAGRDPDALITKFRDALQQQGLDVTSGLAGVLNLPEQYCLYQADNALYANNEPYVQLLVPDTTLEPPQLSAIFKLRPDEAVVLIGLTPPPERYFSYTPYLWSKLYPDGIRRETFSTLADSVSNATVHTIGPTPFNSPVVLIFTPDQGTDAGIRAALRKAGYPEAIVNTLVFPASMLHLGQDEAADELRIVHRNGVWDHPETGEGARYLADIANNLHVFRVTPHTPAAVDPFPAPPLRLRGTGQTEMDLMNTLGELRHGIIDANPGYEAVDIVTMPMCYEGYDLVQRGLEICGDSRDAFYIGAGIPEYDPINDIRLDDGEFLVLYGVNHVATGKATYMNTNVYASETAQLTLGAIDDRGFFDTATPYLPAGDPAADLLYAYKVSRSCGDEENCLQLAVPDGCTRLTLDSSTLLGVFTRIYLEPATDVGPAMPEILYDRVLKFSP